MSSLGRQQLESWTRTLDIKCDKVIDFGGSQLPISNRVKSWDVKEYVIQDLEVPHICKQEPEICFDLNKSIWDPLKNTNINTFKEKFDLAFALEISEYLWNPIQALKNMNFFLKEGGLLYFSTHFNYPVHNIVEFDYLRYTRAGVKKILEMTGFEIVDITPRTCQMNTGYPDLMNFYSKQGMKFAKGYAGHQETGFLVTAKKIK